MWFRNIFILFFFVIISDIAYAQGLSIKDSSHFSEKIDSTHLNNNIESFSGRSKFSKYLFHLIFKPTTTAIKKNEPLFFVIRFPFFPTQPNPLFCAQLLSRTGALSVNPRPCTSPILSFINCKKVFSFSLITS